MIGVAQRLTEYRLIVTPNATSQNSQASSSAANQVRQADAKKFEEFAETFLVRKGTDKVGLSGTDIVKRKGSTLLLNDIIYAKKKLAVGDNNLCQVKYIYYPPFIYTIQILELNMTDGL